MVGPWYCPRKPLQMFLPSSSQGPRTAVVPSYFSRQCPCYLCSYFSGFARSPDSLLPTFQRLCFPSLSFDLQMPTHPKQCSEVELYTVLGARQLGTLGQATSLSSERSVPSCCCVISTRGENRLLFSVFVFGKGYPLICDLELYRVSPPEPSLE